MDITTRFPPRVLPYVAVFAGLLFQLLLGTSYIAASLDPVGESTGLPVAVVVLDEGARGEQFLATLQERDSPIAWQRFETRAAAFEALREKRAYGALVLPTNFTSSLESFAAQTPRAAVVEVWSNPGASTSGNLVAARATELAVEALEARVREQILAGLQTTPFGAAAGGGAVLMSPEQARFLADPVLVQESAVNSVPTKGANGLAPTYLAMACWIGGYIGSVALERFRPLTGLRAMPRTMLVAGAAMVQGALATVALDLAGFDVADPVLLAAVLALGTWMAYAVVTLLTDLFGLGGLVPAFAILSLGLPAAGAMYPAEMLPAFYRALHPFSPFTWLVEALRTTLYAHGATDLAASLLLLSALAVACTIVSLTLAASRGRKGAAPAEPFEDEAASG